MKDCDNLQASHPPLLGLGATDARKTRMAKVKIAVACSHGFASPQGLFEAVSRHTAEEVLTSGLRPNFRADSDLDFLVEFHPTVRIGLVQFIHLKRELESALGREVDIVPKRGLKSLIRDSVLQRTELAYAG